MSVLATWCAAVVVGLHVCAQSGVNCERMQTLLTNTLQRHWEWQEERQTAFNVAKPSGGSKIII